MIPTRLASGAIRLLPRRGRNVRLRGSVAIATLASAAIGNALIYLFVFARPYSLFALHDRPLLDLPFFAQKNPAVPVIFLWAFVALGGLYWLGWRATAEVRGSSGWAIVIAGALLSGSILLCFYPLDAADIFDNIMHGRILGVYGANPFERPPTEFKQDPFYPYVGWKRTTSAYGPLWEAMAAAVARLAGDGIVANVLGFKLLGGLFLAGSAALVAAILRRSAPERSLGAVLLLVWNPLVLYETLGNGHNDIAMAFWMLASVWAMMGGRYTTAIIALLLGALVKYIPVLLIPAAGLIALRDLATRQARLRFVAVTACAAAALVALAYLPFWNGLDTLGVARRTRLFTSSLPAVAYVLLEPQWGNQRAATTVSATAAGLTALFALWQALRAARDRGEMSFAHSGFNILMFYLLVACLFFQPWYAIWPLSIAVLLSPGSSASLGVLFSFAVLAKPLIFDPMFVWLRPFPPQRWRELRLGPAVMAVPWLWVAIRAWSSRKRGAEAGHGRGGWRSSREGVQGGGRPGAAMTIGRTDRDAADRRSGRRSGPGGAPRGGV